MARRARRWLRRIMRRPAVSLEREAPRPTPGQRAATQALYRAECDRDLGESRAGEVTAAADRLREARERNHFAEMIRLSLGGHT